MVGSTNPSGQSSSNLFDSQSVFGQINGSSSNPFAPKPFGSTTSFGSQTSSSLFGYTSTGVLGASQFLSPFSSTTNFGTSSSPAFGNSVPAFGSSSTSAFGNSSSSSAGSSVYGQKPFGSTTQTRPFGNAREPSQPKFKSSNFGSSIPFGASSPPTCGSTSTPAFGTSGQTAKLVSLSAMPIYKDKSHEELRWEDYQIGDKGGPINFSQSTGSVGFNSTTTQTNTFPPSQPASGSSIFGSTRTPVFGAGGGFGALNTPLFGPLTTSPFGTSSPPALGDSTAPAFGNSGTPSFSFGPTQTSCQSTSALGRSPFGSTSSPFEGQSSPFRSQTTSSAFGSTGIGGQRGGSRVANYEPTADADLGTWGETAKLKSISAMPIYKDKSHEELKWEDYQIGDKGGPLNSAQSTRLVGFNSTTTQTNTFASAPAFGQPALNRFSTPKSICNNEFTI